MKTSDCDIHKPAEIPHDALMRPSRVLLFMSLLTCPGLTACLSGSAPAAPGPDLAALTLVLVSEGEGAEGAVKFGEREVFEAHRSFLEGEAEARRLLVSGPFLPTPGGVSGLLVFDVEDPREVEQILASAPAVSAGLLEPTLFPLVTLATLRDLPEIEQRRVTSSGGSGGDTRRYLVLMVEDGGAALEAIQHPSLAPTVLLLGQLGEPTPGGLFAVLDLESARELSARLRVAGVAEAPEQGAWRTWEWFSTPALEAFAFRASGPQPPSNSASK